MPIFEHGCTVCGQVSEHYLPLSWSGDPPCDICGGVTKRLVSRFAVVFTGKISGTKYNDPKIEGYHRDGHWAFNRDGSPEFIDNFQQQREFSKRNKFLNPTELPKNAEVSDDGKSLSTRGMSGQWI